MLNKKKFREKLTEALKRFLNKLFGGGDHDDDDYYGDEDNYDKGDYGENYYGESHHKEDYYYGDYVEVYKIDEHITLKFENGETNIYIGKKYFRQCLGLFLFVDNPEVYDSIKSIDDVSEKQYMRQLDRVLTEYAISPRVKFLGHCFNIQTWVRNNYDTRILHSNLSFPLLKRLVDLGVLGAKKTLIAEIKDRYWEGSLTQRLFLAKEGFLEYLVIDEVRTMIESLTEELKRVSNDKDTLIRLEILMKLFYLAEDDVGVINVCLDYLKINPTNELVWKTLGCTLKYNRQYEGAKSAFLSLLELNSSKYFRKIFL